MSKKLEQIREKIDRLDNKIHDLLMERADLVSDVAEEKKKNNLQIVHPAREAGMIRRLLDRHSGALPEQAVVRIWRELVGAVSLMQSGLKVVVCDPQGDGGYWDMARNYFGSVIPMQKVSNPLVALSTVREDEASFAVMPWPVETEENPWWSFLAHQEGLQKIRIVCALPYGLAKGEAFSSLNLRGLVISKIDFKGSGKDNSVIIAELDPAVSRGRVYDACKAAGLEPLSIYTRSGNEFGGNSVHFIEVKGYYDSEDSKLAALNAEFDGEQSYFALIGGYPALPEFKNAPNQTSESYFEQPPKAALQKSGT